MIADLAARLRKLRDAYAADVIDTEAYAAWLAGRYPGRRPGATA